MSWKGYGEISGSYWISTKTNAKKRGIVFDVSIEYAWNLFEQQKRKCSLSGIDINFRNNTYQASFQTASLDRIDSSKGYVEGNVQWIHKDINYMKSDIKQSEFIKYCKLIANNFKDSV